MIDVLVISRGIIHPSICCRHYLRKMLVSEGRGINFIFTTSLSKIRDLNRFKAVVLYFHEKELSGELTDGLVSYVDNGGKLLCMHGALASFKTNETYGKLTGSQFTGHDKIRDFEATGSGYFRIKDELYEFRMSEDCDIRMSCGDTPVYWLKRQGMGIVASLSPGHRAATFQNDDFRKTVSDIIFKDMGIGDSDG